MDKLTRLGVLFRLLWRLLVLVLTFGLAYVTAFVAFPYLDKRLPLLEALLLLYLALAYLGIPAIIRFWRLAIRPNHIPLYAVTPDGWPSDPVNIVILAKNQQQLISAMAAAGWQQADKANLKNLAKMLWAVLLNRPYATAPFSSLHLFGRAQDIGFQIQQGNPPTPRHRHHVRFWRLPLTPGEHARFWQIALQDLLIGKREVWVGAATHDIAPFAIRWRSGQITHLIDEMTDRERDFLIDSLKQAKALGSLTTVKAGQPLRFRGQTFGVNIVADGYVKVVKLRRFYR
ncbi:MAG: hypothetical protein EOT04_01590 [Candidatus Chaera renei]|uniref:LssY-like C-terminal domain-containing protein n=1 Tax=Candidatus Chaera renei TaxID=2506947 RepID=A0A4Q0AJG5_9BACT|nr:MAG: hypothetical protein EOT04_01590 [Candidatus Chaera renei]